MGLIELNLCLYVSLRKYFRKISAYSREFDVSKVEIFEFVRFVRLCFCQSYRIKNCTDFLFHEKTYDKKNIINSIN